MCGYLIEAARMGNKRTARLRIATRYMTRDPQKQAGGAGMVPMARTAVPRVGMATKIRGDRLSQVPSGRVAIDGDQARTAGTCNVCTELHLKAHDGARQ